VFSNLVDVDFHIYIGLTLQRSSTVVRAIRQSLFVVSANIDRDRFCYIQEFANSVISCTDYQTVDDIKVFYCKHVFHESCLSSFDSQVRGLPQIQNNTPMPFRITQFLEFRNYY